MPPLEDEGAVGLPPILLYCASHHEDENIKKKCVDMLCVMYKLLNIDPYLRQAVDTSIAFHEIMCAIAHACCTPVLSDWSYSLLQMLTTISRNTDISTIFVEEGSVAQCVCIVLQWQICSGAPDYDYLVLDAGLPLLT